MKSLIEYYNCVHPGHTAIRIGAHDQTGLPLHRMVQRVNYLTVKLWMAEMNEIIKKRGVKNISTFNKVTWLVLQRNYRNEIQKEILSA